MKLCVALSSICMLHANLPKLKPHHFLFPKFNYHLIVGIPSIICSGKCPTIVAEGDCHLACTLLIVVGLPAI